MPKVRLNYDGWLALPAATRHKLGVDTGDELEVEVVDGRIVLRPLKSAVAAESPAVEELPPPPMQLEPAPAVAAKSGVKRGPGRPRKAASPGRDTPLRAGGLCRRGEVFSLAGGTSNNHQYVHLVGSI